MRHTGLRSLIVVLGGVALLGIVLVVASTVDARPPTVTAYRLTQQAGAADRALITSGIEIAFSEAVDRESAEQALIIRPAVPGSISWSGRTLTFTPDAPLPLETSFEVVVQAGVRDDAGNRMPGPAEPFSFETAGAPTVTETEPAEGAADVARGAPLAIEFSALMDTASVADALTISPSVRWDLVWVGERLEIVPTEPLEPDTDYELRVETSASDVAGVALAAPFTLGFRTAGSGIAAEAFIPADGSDGISPSTPIAVIFDRALAPGPIPAEMLRVTPAVPGSLEAIPLPGEYPDGPARLLRFVPSGALPATTTFRVEVAAGLRAADGGGLVEPLRWSFTTGAPLATLGNQIAFLSDRGGVTNVWAMNPDGSAQRQVSAEVAPVLDYAVDPGGRSIVVADGRRLVRLDVDGGGRQVLTEDGYVDYDPAFAPDGRTLAFGRADASTGDGLGIWQRPADGGDARRVQFPDELGVASPTASGRPPERDPLLRAPRYAPDSSALAFVDTSGRVGIVELSPSRLTTVRWFASGPPAWLPGSSGILVSGDPDGSMPAAPDVADGDDVPPLTPAAGTREAQELAALSRSGVRTRPTSLEPGAGLPAVDERGRVAVVRWTDDGEGRLAIAEAHDEPSRTVPIAADLSISWVEFAPEQDLVVLAGADPGRSPGIWVLDLEAATLERLARDGERPRWLP